jgi:hypothetical protein
VNYDVRTEAELRDALSQISSAPNQLIGYKVTFKANVSLNAPLQIRTSHTLRFDTNGFDVVGPISMPEFSSIQKSGKGRLELSAGNMGIDEGTVAVYSGNVWLVSYSSRDITLQAGGSFTIGRLGLNGPMSYDGFCGGALPTHAIDTNGFVLTVDDFQGSCALLKKTGAPGRHRGDDARRSDPRRQWPALGDWITGWRRFGFARDRICDCSADRSTVLAVSSRLAAGRCS